MSAGHSQHWASNTIKQHCYGCVSSDAAGLPLLCAVILKYHSRMPTPYTVHEGWVTRELGPSCKGKRFSFSFFLRAMQG